MASTNEQLNRVHGYSTDLQYYKDVKVGDNGFGQQGITTKSQAHNYAPLLLGTSIAVIIGLLLTIVFLLLKRQSR